MKVSRTFFAGHRSSASLGCKRSAASSSSSWRMREPCSISARSCASRACRLPCLLRPCVGSSFFLSGPFPPQEKRTDYKTSAACLKASWKGSQSTAGGSPAAEVPQVLPNSTLSHKVIILIFSFFSANGRMMEKSTHSLLFPRRDFRFHRSSLHLIYSCCTYSTSCLLTEGGSFGALGRRVPRVLLVSSS